MTLARCNANVRRTTGLKGPRAGFKRAQALGRTKIEGPPLVDGCPRSRRFVDRHAADRISGHIVLPPRREPAQAFALIIHERFYCNRGFAAATSLAACFTAPKRVGSLLVSRGDFAIP